MKTKRIAIAGLVGLPLLVLLGLAAVDDDSGTAVAHTEVVQRRDLFSTVTGSGLIQPRRKVDISADVSGRVVQLAVQEGQWVNQGDLLLRIDPTRQQSAVYRAQAAVAQSQASAEQVRTNWLQARAALSRSEELAGEKGWVTRAELEQARSQVAMLQAQLRSAEFAVQQSQASLAETQDALDKTTITAPMSGRVTRLNIQEGETAVVGTMNNPGSLLLTIADLTEMEVRIRVDETDVPSIALGARAVVRIDAFPRQGFTGQVVRISNSASRGGGAQSAHFQVVVALDPTPVPLHPELSANADVVTAVRKRVLAIPILALTARDPAGRKPDAPADGGGRPPRGSAGPMREGVFVLRDGVAHWTPVRVGISGKSYFEVTEGLSGGETVVAGSYQLVRELEDQDEVDSAPAGPAPEGRAPARRPSGEPPAGR
jgi:HlyD family secretion protein